jgi:hypothetical protein
MLFFWAMLAVPFFNDKITYASPGRWVSGRSAPHRPQYLDNLYWLAPGLLGYGVHWYRRRHLAPTGGRVWEGHPPTAGWVNVAIDRWIAKGSLGLQKLMEVVPEKED